MVMHKFSKLSFVFLILASLIVLIAIPTTVQAASKLSVPQFSLRLFDNSYNVPPSTTTNSYTGVTTTKSGYRVNNMTIEITIKNQPFTPYTDTRGYDIDLYYQVDFKGHFGGETEWHACYAGYNNGYAQIQSNSGHTVVSVVGKYDAGSQLDFRVEAFTGYWFEPSMGEFLAGIREPYLVRDESSGYSGIQTITVTYGSSSLSPSQSATFPPVNSDGNSQPQSPDQSQPSNVVFTNPFFTLVIGMLFCGVVVAVVMILLRSHLKPSIYNNNSSQTNTYNGSSLFI
jgi:hypothetical protein